MLSQDSKPVKSVTAVTAVSGFKLVGGELCLDFVNTVGARGALEKREKLTGFEELVQWSELAGVIARPDSVRLIRFAVRDSRASHALLLRAIDLREALYRIFKSTLEGSNPLKPDMVKLNREIAVARSRESLVHSGRAFAWKWQEPSALDCMLWPVATSAAELLTSRKLTLLQRCADEECGWMFLDTSRNRSRHWCDMRDCGNRAKVARFRRRLRQ